MNISKRMGLVLILVLCVASLSEAQERSTGEAVLLNWQHLEQDLDAATDGWFDGAVIVVRDGKTVLQKGIGLANREKKIPNRIDTVFAIGSAPIDFTKVGILMLMEQGKLNLDDGLEKHFKNVPEDKRAITIRHLMNGQSGLPNFHDLPGDENPDHTWIDRDEAVRRIFAQMLLFEPGHGKEHSHSAWGLLAAIIEITSGQTYPEFTKQHLFGPLEMNDTGFFGEPVDENRIAVGYGQRKSSDPNSPPNWGKTSWLVMGSGGQISTLPDMVRWETGIRSGKILAQKTIDEFIGSGGVSADGDMFGFEFMHTSDPDNMFLLISNSVSSREKREKFERVAQGLMNLFRPVSTPPKFTIGVMLGVAHDGEVQVHELIPGGAAEKAGLLPHDLVISANGKILGDDPMSILRPLLEKQEPIEVEVERDGKKLKFSVTPTPRG